MRIRLRLTGELARAHGPRLELTLPEGATVAAALAEIGGPSSVRVARRGELVADDAALADGDELALVVPVAGGAPGR